MVDNSPSRVPGHPVLATLLAGVLVLGSLAPLAQAQQASTQQASTQQTGAPASPNAAPAAAGPGVLELREQANRAYAAGDMERYRDALLQLHERRPYNGSYMALLVLAYAMLNDRSRAYEMMLVMQRQGLAWDFNDTQESENIRGTEVYEYVNDLLVKAKEPFGEAQVLFQLPSDVVLPTSMAWDASRESWLIGDARRGAVHAVNRVGEVTPLLEADAANGLWAIFGLAVDAPNNRLWVASSASETQVGYDPIDAGRSALLELRLDNLELVRRYPVPVDGSPHRLGGLVRTVQGDIYAVDTILPIIYRLQAGADRLRPYLAAPGMVNLRGITQSEDGRTLYVADYEMGILVIDVLNNQARELVAPDNLNLGGIEGLFYQDRQLIAIQNGNEPQRIMRLGLDGSGIAVESVAPLAVAQPFFDYPNFGVLMGDELVYLANSHWVRDLERPEPIRVARTPVAAAEDLTEVDREAMLRQMRERSAQAPAPSLVPGLIASQRAESQAEQAADESAESEDGAESDPGN